MVPRGKLPVLSFALASLVVAISTAAAPTTSLASVTTVNVYGLTRA